MSNQKDIDEFLAELREDRKKSKDRETKDAWIKWVSLSLVFIAVLTAFAAGKGAGCASKTAKYLSEATYNQSQASNQWAFFQAKAQKQAVAEVALELVEQRGDFEKISSTKIKISRYEVEKEQISKEAKHWEEQRDKSRKDAEMNSVFGPKFNYSASVFQVAIELGSIAIMLKRKPLWYASLTVAIYAVAWLAFALRSVSAALGS
jgi:hypothetical protein